MGARRLREWRKQAFGDARPAPVLDDRLPGRPAESLALGLVEREEGAELALEVGCVGGREAGERAVLGRILLFEPGGDLCQARLAGYEGERAASRRLASTR